MFPVKSLQINVVLWKLFVEKLKSRLFGEGTLEYCMLDLVSVVISIKQINKGFFRIIRICFGFCTRLPILFAFHSL